MNKSRKAAKRHNVISHDNNGNVTLPADLILSVAPGSSDDSSKVTTTAWIRAYFSTSISTYVPQTRTITINGEAYDLSANRSWTIAGGVTSFNTRTGAISLISGDVTTALGFTPYNATNPAGYITSAALSGYVPTTRTVTVNGDTQSLSGNVSFTVAGGVTSFNTRTGAITLTSADVTGALGFTPYNATNPSGYITGITSGMVTTALGFTPYNSTNPAGYTTNTGTVTSVSGTGTVSGLTLSGTVTTSGSLTLGGTLSLTSGNVTTALGFTPYNSTNPSGYITGISFANVSAKPTTLAGYGITDAASSSHNHDAAYVPLSRTLTINGVTFDLSANRSYTVSGADATKLPLAGGTMTGGLVINTPSNGVGTGLQLYSTAFHQYLQIYSNGGIEAMLNVRNNAAEWYVGLRTTTQLVGTTGFHFYNSTSAQTVGGYDISGNHFAIGSSRSPIFYDSADTSYYCDPNSTSRLHTVSSFYFRNIHDVSTDHAFGVYFNNSTDQSYAIFRENGGWGHPYPDLRIAFHTGIKLGAYFGYNGTRFYNNSDMATITASVNDGDNNFRGFYDIIAFASDRRLKHNIQPIENALSKVASLTGMTYQWNNVGSQHGWQPDTEIREAGVFAQDVQAVLPEAVKLAPFDNNMGISKSGENFLTVKYEKIVPLLIEAIKEQQVQLMQQKAQIDELIEIVKTLKGL